MQAGSTHRRGADGVGEAGVRLFTRMLLGNRDSTESQQQAPTEPYVPTARGRRELECSSLRGTWMIKKLTSLIQHSHCQQWDGSSSHHPPRRLGMEPRPRRATGGHPCRPSSTPGNPGMQTWPRLASQVQGPPSSGLPAPPRAASSCPPPEQSSQRLTAPVSLGPHPGQETGCSESSQPTPGTGTEIIVPTRRIQSHPQHN